MVHWGHSFLIGLFNEDLVLHTYSLHANAFDCMLSTLCKKTWLWYFLTFNCAVIFNEGKKRLSSNLIKTDLFLHKEKGLRRIKFKCKTAKVLLGVVPNTLK